MNEQFFYIFIFIIVIAILIMIILTGFMEFEESIEAETIKENEMD